MVEETSIKALRELKEKKIIGLRQEAVLEAIRDIGPCTDSEIMKHLRFKDRNAVSPRRNELMNLQVIKKHDVRTCKITGFKATTWIIDIKVMYLLIIGHEMINKKIICKHCKGKGKIIIKTWKK